MMSGKDLKRMVSMIPDNAVVTVNGNYYVDITNINVEAGMDIRADLRLTEGYSITKDSVLDGMFESLKEKII